MLIQPTRGAGVFTRLIGQPLCAVTFIWDYYQALIGNETLSIFTHPKVTVGDRIMLVGMPGYRDALCGRIGKRTVGFDRRREQVSLRFDDGSLITLSFRPADRIGGSREVLECRGVDGAVFVIGN